MSSERHFSHHSRLTGETNVFGYSRQRDERLRAIEAKYVCDQNDEDGWPPEQGENKDEPPDA